MEKTLQEIAAYVDGQLAGSGDAKITGVNNLEAAGKTEITFADEAHFEYVDKTAAAAVIVPVTEEKFSKPVIQVKDPRVAFAKLLQFFTPELKLHKGVSKQAFIGEDVTIGENVTIMPFAVVDDHAKIGDNVVLYPHTYIGQYASVGKDTVIYSNTTVREFCEIGERVVLHNSTVIGGDGFGFTTTDGVHTKVPQVGKVIVEDDVEIGCHVGIDRATTGATVIGHGTKIDNLVHIGHNCKIGANNLIVAQTGISGSTVVGHNVTFGGQVGTVGHINIGANSVFAARSGIIGNTPEGVFYAGFPARPHQEWLRTEAVLKHLPELNKRIKQLEKKLEAYEAKE